MPSTIDTDALYASAQAAARRLAALHCEELRVFGRAEWCAGVVIGMLIGFAAALLAAACVIR